MNVFLKLREISLQAPEDRYKYGVNVDLEYEGLKIRDCFLGDEDIIIEVEGRTDRDILNDLLSFFEKKILPHDAYRTTYLSRILEAMCAEEEVYASPSFATADEYLGIPAGVIKLVFHEEQSGNYEGILVFELEKVTDDHILEKTQEYFKNRKKLFDTDENLFQEIQNCINCEWEMRDEHYLRVFKLLKDKFEVSNPISP